MSGEYIKVCADFGIIALSAKITIDEAVDVVGSIIEYDEFSVCDDIISDFKDILQDKWLSILKSEVIAFLNPQRIEKKSLEKFKKK